MDFKALAKTYSTPLYVYDFDEITSRYNALKSAFNARKSLICYAVKANSNLSLLKHLAQLGAGFDCVSGGEVKRALLAGAKPYQVIFSGVGKSDVELELALKSDILFINVESHAELKSLINVAKNLGKKARISIRVNPNVDAKTHPYISTGLSENKFGVSIGVARAMYLMASESEFIEPVGVHFHIGSQLSDLAPIAEAAAIVSDFMASLKAAKIDIKFFDVGGGIGIVYDDEKTINLYEYAQAILAALKSQDVTIVCEPGRFIVGEAGYFLTKVLYEKQNDKKRFVIVDGAMNDLIRPSLYSAYHRIRAPYVSGDESAADVVGAVCESGDFLGKDVSLPALKSEDLLVVYSSGAYGFSMASNYNTRPRPAEVAVSGGKNWLIRSRESFDDMIKNEIEFIGASDER